MKAERLCLTFDLVRQCHGVFCGDWDIGGGVLPEQSNMTPNRAEH
jgi:hypothetical protein